MSEGTPKVFPTAVDWWLAVIVVSVPLFSLATAISFARSAPSEAWISGFTFVFAIALGYLLVWPMHYIVTDSELLVKSGKLLRVRIPARDIKAVTPTKNPLSSPALSLKRLRIDYGDGKWVLISPKDRAGFISALEAATGLPRDGERLGHAGA